MCFVIMRFQIDDDINFEIDLRFFVKPFPYMTKRVRAKF